MRGSATSGVCTTGLAVLRRDGFASMDAGETQGALTTRPVTFRGKYLFVNIDDPQGELRVEVLDRDCRAIRPFTSDNLRARAGRPDTARCPLERGERFIERSRQTGEAP